MLSLFFASVGCPSKVTELLGLKGAMMMEASVVGHAFSISCTSPRFCSESPSCHRSKKRKPSIILTAAGPTFSLILSAFFHPIHMTFSLRMVDFLSQLCGKQESFRLSLTSLGTARALTLTRGCGSGHPLAKDTR